MSLTQYIVICYALFWAIRIRGSVRRWRQPLLRGPEWFFKVHVQPGFYTGPGKKILHQYWMRLFIPFAVDIAVATAIFISGRLLLLRWLIVGLAALIHLNHMFSVDLAERQARLFAVAEAEQPVPALVFSLKTRRLRDYTNRKFEAVIVLCLVGALAWLIRYYFAAPDHPNLRLVFGGPALLLYMQAGLILVKRVVVTWRTPVPQAHVDEYLAAREATRKFYLTVCDLNRAYLAIAIALWPVLLTVSSATRKRIGTMWLVTALTYVVVGTIWHEIRRKKLLAVTLQARPVKLPDLMGHSKTLMWPVCYLPSAPMSVLKGARGYSLNLANTLTQAGAAYLAGLVVLMVLLQDI